MLYSLTLLFIVLNSSKKLALLTLNHHGRYIKHKLCLTPANYMLVGPFQQCSFPPFPAVLQLSPCVTFPTTIYPQLPSDTSSPNYTRELPEQRIYPGCITKQIEPILYC